MYLTGIRIKRTKKVGNNMNFKIRNLLAAAMAFVMMISLTACSSDKQKKYEQLKTDIVGVWCDIDGPEYFENEGNPYYKLYEFTSEGGLIYHTPMAMGSVYTEDTYEISDDFLTVGNGGKCRIEIDNDVLTMIYNGGSSQYRKMSMEEVCNFGVYYIDADNYQKQLDYLGLLYGTDSEGHKLNEDGSIREETSANASDTSTSEETSAAE